MSAADSMWRWALSLFFVLSLQLPAPAVALADAKVDVRIEVIKASRSEKGFDAGSRRHQKQLENTGFVGATTLDTLKASGRTVGSALELRFRDPSRTERSIRVTVLESSAEKTKLNVTVPSYNLSTVTTHVKGGVFLVVVPKDDLVLAIQPTH